MKEITSHRPPHIYQDDAIYFISASTCKKEKFFNTDEKKNIFCKFLNKFIKTYGFSLYAWVLLDNHYHLLLKILKGELLPKFINRLHANSAKDINRADRTKGRQVWYQYWDECLKPTKYYIQDFYRWFNYSHINPIKHGYLKIDRGIIRIREKEIIIPKEHRGDLIKILKHWRFSSFNSHIKRYGEEWMNELWINCPIPRYIDGG